MQKKMWQSSPQNRGPSGADGQFQGTAGEQKSLQHFLVINFMKMFSTAADREGKGNGALLTAQLGER